MQLGAIPGVRVVATATARPHAVLAPDGARLERVATDVLLRHLHPAAAADGERLAFLRAGVAERIGVDGRSWVRWPGTEPAGAGEETVVELAARALEALLDRAGRAPGDVGGLIVCTSTPARFTSANAPAVAARVGLAGPALDLRSGCSGALAALVLAAGWVRGGGGPVAVVGAETFSKVTPPADKSAMLALGDGAAAVLLDRADPARAGILATTLGTDGTLGSLVGTRGPMPPTHRAIDEGAYLLEGDPDTLARVVPGRYVEILEDVLGRSGTAAGDLAALVLHQSSLPLYRFVTTSLGVEPGRAPRVVDRWGNVGAAGVLVALDAAHEASLLHGRFALAAVGGGLSWGAQVWSDG